MRRRLLNLLTAVSLLLCVATAVLWARSYNVLYQLRRTDVDRATGGVRVRTCLVAGGRVVWSVTRYRGKADFYTEGVPPEGWRLFRDPYFYAWRPPEHGPWFGSWKAQPGGGATAWGPAGTSRD